MIEDHSVSGVEASFVGVRSLSKRFGDHVVLDNVSFGVAKGHTMALLGPSGCGKTTILRCLAGLETAEHGAIEIAEQTVFDHDAGIDLMPEKRQLGIVFQSYAVWPHMSVADNVGFPLKVRRIAKPEIRARVRKVLAMVGLDAWETRSATQLSGGQQQRVALARALVHEPRVVLFDEALSNLDTQLREQMRVELKVLQDRLGFTAVYVTHDQAEALALADHVVVMNHGKVELAGTPREIFRHPRTPFVARFLGYNLLEGTLDAVLPAPQLSGSVGETRYARVAFPGGGSLWGWLSPDAQARPGAKAFACIRREHAGLRSAAAAGRGRAKGQNIEGPNSPDRNQTVAAEVVASSFQGLTEEYVLQVAGQELRAVQAALDVRRGERIDLCVSPDNCIILPLADQ